MPLSKVFDTALHELIIVNDFNVILGCAVFVVEEVAWLARWSPLPGCRGHLPTHQRASWLVAQVQASTLKAPELQPKMFILSIAVCLNC